MNKVKPGSSLRFDIPVGIKKWSVAAPMNFIPDAPHDESVHRRMSKRCFEYVAKHPFLLGGIELGRIRVIAHIEFTDLYRKSCFRQNIQPANNIFFRDVVPSNVRLNTYAINRRTGI